MKIIYRKLLCNANPCRYIPTKAGTWFYRWNLVTHFAPIRFSFDNVECANFTYKGISIFILRKYIITFKFK